MIARAQAIDIANIDGKDIQLIPYENDVNPYTGASNEFGTQIYKWLCDPTTFGGVPAKYLPGSCRS